MPPPDSARSGIAVGHRHPSREPSWSPDFLRQRRRRSRGWKTASTGPRGGCFDAGGRGIHQPWVLSHSCRRAASASVSSGSVVSCGASFPSAVTDTKRWHTGQSARPCGQPSASGSAGSPGEPEPGQCGSSAPASVHMIVRCRCSPGCPSGRVHRRPPLRLRQKRTVPVGAASVTSATLPAVGAENDTAGPAERRLRCKCEREPDAVRDRRTDSSSRHP